MNFPLYLLGVAVTLVFLFYHFIQDLDTLHWPQLVALTAGAFAWPALWLMGITITLLGLLKGAFTR